MFAYLPYLNISFDAIGEKTPAAIINMYYRKVLTVVLS